MATRFSPSPHPHPIRRQGAVCEGGGRLPPLDAKGKNFIQRVNGKFLYLGRAVDLTILTALSALAAQQASPTEETMRRAKQLLDYLVTQEDAIITYRVSNMVFAVHSNSSYLSESGARSRVGEHFSCQRTTQFQRTMALS